MNKEREQQLEEIIGGLFTIVMELAAEMGPDIWTKRPNIKQGLRRVDEAFHKYRNRLTDD